MSDTKHGWVTPRADGARARCGGPGLCPTCNTEAMHEKMLSGLFGAPADVGAASAADDTPLAGAAARLSIMASEARKQYQVELAAGGEPTWPAWVDDLAVVLRLNPAPAAGDAQDDETRWTLRWIMREADAAKETCGTDPESPAAIRNAKLAAIATAAAQALGLVRGPSYADPGAGDAQDAARWRWIFSHAENVGFDYQSGRFTTLTIAGRRGDSLVAFVDAALAASQQQEG